MLTVQCMPSEFTTFTLCYRLCMVLHGAKHGRGAPTGAHRTPSQCLAAAGPPRERTARLRSV